MAAEILKLHHCIGKMVSSGGMLKPKFPKKLGQRIRRGLTKKGCAQRRVATGLGKVGGREVPTRKGRGKCHGFRSKSKEGGTNPNRTNLPRSKSQWRGGQRLYSYTTQMQFCFQRIVSYATALATVDVTMPTDAKGAGIAAIVSLASKILAAATKLEKSVAARNRREFGEWAKLAIAGVPGWPIATPKHV